MLKAFLACLLVSAAVSPTFSESAIRVGMTKQQVEQLLGTPFGLHGDYHGLETTFDTYLYGGRILVSFSNGKVSDFGQLGLADRTKK